MKNWINEGTIAASTCLLGLVGAATLLVHGCGSEINKIKPEIPQVIFSGAEKNIRIDGLKDISFKAADLNRDGVLTESEMDKYKQIYRCSLYNQLHEREPLVDIKKLDSMTTNQLEDYLLGRARK